MRPLWAGYLTGEDSALLEPILTSMASQLNGEEQDPETQYYACHAAALTGSVNLLISLHDAGFEAWNQKGPNGETVWHIAVSNHFNNILYWLGDNKIPGAFQLNDEGYAPFDLVVPRNENSNHLVILFWLMCQDGFSEYATTKAMGENSALRIWSQLIRSFLVCVDHMDDSLYLTTQVVMFTAAGILSNKGLITKAQAQQAWEVITERRNYLIPDAHSPHHSPVRFLPATKKSLRDNTPEACARLGIPAAWHCGAVDDQGDCFFEAAAVALNERILGGDVQTVKTLRMLCDRYAKDPGVNGWVERENINDQQNHNQYLVRIGLDRSEMEQQLFGESPIWGRFQIEGRMFCHRLDIRLHVMVLPEAGHVMHYFVTKDGIVDCKKADDCVNDDWYQDDKTIHLVLDRFHFVPVLSQCSTPPPSPNNGDQYDAAMDDTEAWMNSEALEQVSVSSNGNGYGIFSNDPLPGPDPDPSPNPGPELDPEPGSGLGMGPG